jgi:nucleoside 2-deoxyribosyltransferase
MEELGYMSQQWRDAVFANDYMNIHKADLLVAVYDGDDAGTFVELGMAFALRIPIVVFCETGIKANLMATEAATAWLGSRHELLQYDFNALPKRPYNGPMV